MRSKVTQSPFALESIMVKRYMDVVSEVDFISNFAAILIETISHSYFKRTLFPKITRGKIQTVGFFS